MKTSKSYLEFIPPIILGVFIFALAYYLGLHQSTDKDWDDCFRPGAQLLVTGGNPHDLEGCHYMSWALLPLVPIAFLPVAIGRAALSTISLMTYFLVAKKMGASMPVAALMVANPFYLIHNIYDPNIDWLVAIGYVLPPQIGLFFCLTKPQLSIGLVLLWLIEAYQQGGMRRVLSTFLPVTLVFGLTMLIYGPYFLHFNQLLTNPGWNLTFWPYSILVGLLLLVYGLVKRHSGAAILAGPFFSPYMGYYSWPIALLGLLPRRQVIAAVISVAIFVIIILAGIFL